MRNDRHLAIQLRKKGASYNRICQELDIPKSTMCYWFKDLAWSKKIKKKLDEKNIRMSRKRMRAISKANSLRWESLREAARLEASNEFPLLQNNPLFVCGLNLYWGEGDSKLENGAVRLSNTDPRLIRIYSKFVRSILKVPMEKIKVYLILYPDLREHACRKFWSSTSEIPETQFYKAQFIKGRHPTKRLKYGICIIHVSSRQLKEKIMVWTDLFYNTHKNF